MPIFKVVVESDSSSRIVTSGTGSFHFEKEVYYVEADTKMEAEDFAKEKYLKQLISMVEKGIVAQSCTIGIWKTKEGCE